MSDPAATPAVEAESQESFLHRFSDHCMKPLKAKIEEAFSHTYLKIEEVYQVAVEEVEKLAAEAGWKVSKPVVHAMASNMVVSHMLENDHTLVSQAPPAPATKAPANAGSAGQTGSAQPAPASQAQDATQIAKLSQAGAGAAGKPAGETDGA